MKHGISCQVDHQMLAVIASYKIEKVSRTMHAVIEAMQPVANIMSNPYPPTTAPQNAIKPLTMAKQMRNRDAEQRWHYQVSDEDQQAITQTLHGDPTAFNRLVVKYQGFAYSIAYRI